MQRLSLFIWACIGIILLMLCVLFPGMLLQANLMGMVAPQVEIEDVRTDGAATVPGGKMTIRASVTGDVGLIRMVYADTRSVGGPRIDLRPESAGVFQRTNIPIGKNTATGTYQIPVRVVLQNNTQKEHLFTVSIVEGVPETLRGVAEETPKQENTATTLAPVALEETVTQELQPVVTVAAEETIQVFLPTPVHPNAITSTGEQFGVHRFDNYFNTIPIERVALNSTGEIITITTKGLEKGVHYVISTPSLPLKALKGEEEVILPTTLVFEYRTYATGQVQIQHATQTNHKTVEIVFNRPIDMHSLIQTERLCELRTKEMTRMVGASERVEMMSSLALRITMDRSIPTGELELWCTGVRGVFGTSVVARVLKAPLVHSTLPSAQRQMSYRSDFNGDGVIDEQDLHLLLDAIAGK